MRGLSQEQVQCMGAAHAQWAGNQRRAACSGWGAPLRGKGVEANALEPRVKERRVRAQSRESIKAWNEALWGARKKGGRAQFTQQPPGWRRAPRRASRRASRRLNSPGERGRDTGAQAREHSACKLFGLSKGTQAWGAGPPAAPVAPTRGGRRQRSAAWHSRQGPRRRGAKGERRKIAWHCRRAGYRQRIGAPLTDGWWGGIMCHAGAGCRGVSMRVAR